MIGPVKNKKGEAGEIPEADAEAVGEGGAKGSSIHATHRLQDSGMVVEAE